MTVRNVRHQFLDLWETDVRAFPATGRTSAFPPAVSKNPIIRDHAKVKILVPDAYNPEIMPRRQAQEFDAIFIILSSVES